VKNVQVRGLGQLERVLKRDADRLKRKLHAAIRRAASSGERIVDKRVPKAFGELKDSGVIFDDGDVVSIIYMAPHAAAAEVGSRPHLVPLDELVRWVKLRGMQALDDKGGIRKSFKRSEGPTTPGHARSIGYRLRAMEQDGSLAVTAPEQIARAIQHAILVNGTVPHWYARSSLPELRADLDRKIRQALKT